MSDQTTPMNELRDYYDTTHQAAALATATPQVGGGEVLVSTSIRLPKSLMDQVRARAEHAGMPATTRRQGAMTGRLSPAGTARGRSRRPDPSTTA